MHTTLTRIVMVGMIIALGSPLSLAAMLADVMCYFEVGLHASGDVWADPYKALQDDGYGVSLGSWSDDPAKGTNDRPVGLTLGFSTSILNQPGNDLNVVGNAFGGWHEPGYIEVARETSGGGATLDGWLDETFYLIKPSNYDDLPHDPRTAAIPIDYAWPQGYGGIWEQIGSMSGYADVTPGGDAIDISDAVDLEGDYALLPDFAYVRIRTVTDSSPGWGYFSTEVTKLEALSSPIPEPSSAVVFAGLGVVGLIGYRLRRRRRRVDRHAIADGDARGDQACCEATASCRIDL